MFFAKFRQISISNYGLPRWLDGLDENKLLNAGSLRAHKCVNTVVVALQVTEYGRWAT